MPSGPAPPRCPRHVTELLIDRLFHTDRLVRAFLISGRGYVTAQRVQGQAQGLLYLEAELTSHGHHFPQCQATCTLCRAK